MYPLRNHVAGHTLSHSFANVLAGHARRAVKGDNPCCAAISQRPGYRRRQIRAHNLAQMSINLFEFNSVPEYLYLVVDSAQTMERAARVATCQIPSSVPPFSPQHGEVLRRHLSVVQVTPG